MIRTIEAEFLRQMMRIRLFEERALGAFTSGLLVGTTHTYIGQEANAVGVLSAIDNSDIVFSNHRGHGHFLAHGGNMRALAAELMGRSTGVCGGLGGSQHLHASTFYSNGVQGGIVPCATGMALAEKYQETGVIVVAFLGDGTLGEGVVYESLNMAALWGAPILYVLENNHYAQSTPIHLGVAGDIAARFQAFGVQTLSLETTDVELISEVAHKLLGGIRERSIPGALIIDTYRFAPHSKGDDTRDPAEIEHIKQFDPIDVLARRFSPDIYKEIDASCRKEVDIAFSQAENDPWPEPDTYLASPFGALL